MDSTNKNAALSHTNNDDNLKRHNLLSLPSPASLQWHICRWENLLTCSACNVLQNTLEHLWQHPTYVKPICTSCIKMQKTVRDDEQREHLSAVDEYPPARPLSEYMGFGSLTKEEGAKEPALVLQRLRVFLKLMTGDASLYNTFELEERVGLGHGIKDADAQEKTRVGEISSSQKLQANPSSLPEPAAAVHQHYISLPPNFLSNNDSNDKHQHEHDCHEGGCRCREYDGEVLNPGCRIRHSRKRGRSELVEETKEDDVNEELNFPDSKSNTDLPYPSGCQLMKADSTRLNNGPCSHESITTSNQRSEQSTGFSPYHQLRENKKIGTVQEDRHETVPHEPSQQNQLCNTDDRVHQKIADESTSVNHQQEQSSSQTLSQNLLLSQSPSESQQCANFGVPKDAPSIGNGYNQETFDSVDTDKLPQTSDFVRFDTMPTTTARTSLQSSKLLEHGPIFDGGQISQKNTIEDRLPKIVSTKVFPVVGTSQLHTNSTKRSQSQPQSYATDAILETCNIGKFASQNLGQSIASDTLSQSTDVGSLMENERKYKMLLSGRTSPASEPQLFGNDASEGIDFFSDNVVMNSSSHLTASIDSHLLPQTPDFGKPLFYNPLKKHGKIDDNVQRNEAAGRKEETGDSLNQHTDQQVDNLATAGGFLTINSPIATGASSRRITPTSVTFSGWSGSRDQVLEIVLHEDLSREDNLLLFSLVERNFCRVVSINDESRGEKISLDRMPPGRSRYLIFNPDYLKFTRNPFVHDSVISVCLQSFQYLVARALGWKLLSSECLGAVHRGIKDLEEYVVWGDAQIFKAVCQDHVHFLWHETADWWGSPTLSPSESSVKRHEKGFSSLLSNYNVLVAKLDAEEEAKLMAEDCLLLSSLLRDEADIVSEDDVQYKSLCGNEIEMLCSLAGATVMTSFLQIDNPQSKTHVVLIPDTLEDEELFVRLLVEAKTLPNVHVMEQQQHSKINLLYYSWIVDSICADALAPIEYYTVDLLSQILS
ncbi:hypothetical protein IV203_000936 [Nitzschia inconspicua]|uniref:BRCT domain-containing protein n=1 Tax=Nitzschia inconspicua TaxID=303405 RepID=A0A9K3L7E0_9STRA|nr:hypothetical protein IV203_000936 [Nitzschia inconspicua]